MNASESGLETAECIKQVNAPGVDAIALSQLSSPPSLAFLQNFYETTIQNKNAFKP